MINYLLAMEVSWLSTSEQALAELPTQLANVSALTAQLQLVLMLLLAGPVFDWGQPAVTKQNRSFRALLRSDSTRMKSFKK